MVHHLKGRVRVSVPPVGFPVALAELKAHLRITSALEDDYLNTLIATATNTAELYLGRKILTQTLEYYLDALSTGREPWWDGVRETTVSEIRGGVSRSVDLPFLPVQSVSQVDSFDEDGNGTLFPASKYHSDTIDLDLWARVILSRGSVWPSDLRQDNALRFTYIAGYDAEGGPLVPPSIKQGILIIAAYLYENRGDCGGDCSACAAAAGVTGLIDRYRVYEV